MTIALLSRVAIAALVLAVGCAGAPLALAQNRPAASVAIADPVADAIAEASRRFGVPQHWIRAVMRVESAFHPRAVSHAGAMGLMQVMPQTYAELRGRYGLGADPYHPRDNILAGAAYLREMYDRFGARGFLAAYNAGPARYQQHLVDGRPLPLETRAYVAKLAPAVRAALAGRAQRLGALDAGRRTVGARERGRDGGEHESEEERARHRGSKGRTSTLRIIASSSAVRGSELDSIWMCTTLPPGASNATCSYERA